MKPTINSKDDRDMQAFFRRLRLSHPTNKELVKFKEAMEGAAVVDELLRERVKAHIALCPTCETRLALLQEVIDAPEEPVPPELKKFGHRILALTHFPSTSDASQKTEPVGTWIDRLYLFLSSSTIALGLSSAPGEQYREGSIKDKERVVLKWNCRQDASLDLIIGFESDALVENTQIQIVAKSPDSNTHRIIGEPVTLKPFGDGRVFAETIIKRDARSGIRSEDIYFIISRQ